MRRSRRLSRLCRGLARRTPETVGIISGTINMRRRGAPWRTCPAHHGRTRRSRSASGLKGGTSHQPLAPRTARGTTTVLAMTKEEGRRRGLRLSPGEANDLARALSLLSSAAAAPPDGRSRRPTPCPSSSPSRRTATVISSTASRKRAHSARRPNPRQRSRALFRRLMGLGRIATGHDKLAKTTSPPHTSLPSSSGGPSDSEVRSRAGLQAPCMHTGATQRLTRSS
jgi:hypothetical protein